MRHKLTSFFVLLSVIFILASLFAAFVVLIISRRFDVVIAYQRMVIGVFVISLQLALARTMFTLDKPPVWIRLILGYVFIIMAALTIRNVFGVWLFRRTVMLIIFVSIISIIYWIALFVATKRLKKESDMLNSALDKIDKDES